MPIKVVQLSDTHLFAHPDERLLGCPTWHALRRVLESVRAVGPDLIVITGDLSQDGSRASYEHARSLLAPLAVPCYWLPGNHDDLDVMDQVLGTPPFRRDTSFRAGNWQVVLLTSQVPGSTHGALSRETLRWLERQLEAHAGHPTLVALHHPPFPVGSGWLDQIGLRDAAAFLTLIERHPQVRLVLTGHVHQNRHYRYGGTDFYATRSTCIQFKQDSDVFALDVHEQPGFRTFSLFHDGTYTMDPRVVAYDCEWDTSALGY